MVRRYDRRWIPTGLSGNRTCKSALRWATAPAADQADAVPLRQLRGKRIADRGLLNVPRVAKELAPGAFLGLGNKIPRASSAATRRMEHHKCHMFCQYLAKITAKRVTL
jgi:hypothetical protein